MQNVSNVETVIYRLEDISINSNMLKKFALKYDEMTYFQYVSEKTTYTCPQKTIALR